MVASNDLDDLYPAHLRVLIGRADRILAEAGFDALVIHAGAPPTQFLDDQDRNHRPQSGNRIQFVIHHSLRTALRHPRWTTPAAA